MTIFFCPTNVTSPWGYDKHKAIWWARINVGEAMTRDDFVIQQNIAYLDCKHKRGSWHLHQNLAISLRTWAFSHPNYVFYFQDASEDNEIHVPFTIRIQTPSQLQTMVSLGDNRAISMDSTFSTNDWNFICSHWKCLMHIALECRLHGSLQAAKHAMIWRNNQVLWKQCFQGRTLNGNLHVSSLMMFHKNYKHCGEFYFHYTFLWVFMYM
jgi:hypothetical protein